FVIPTGYSFNLDGSTLYLSLAAIFVAQAAGIEMPIGQQFLLLLTLMLTSKGVAGVPRAALVILLGTVSSFNLPAEPVFIILGIEAAGPPAAPVESVRLAQGRRQQARRDQCHEHCERRAGRAVNGGAQRRGKLARLAAGRDRAGRVLRGQVGLERLPRPRHIL